MSAEPREAPAAVGPPLTQPPLAVLKQLLGPDAQFRHPQAEVIDHLLGGGDALVLMPTGGGKSMTFVVPALCRPSGVAVVVSPLLALIKNQVEGLRARGVAACALWGAATNTVRDAIYKDLFSPAPATRILYCTPEGLATDRLSGALESLHRRGKLILFAIDEAHVIFSWGLDFRSQYRSLGHLRDRYPRVPIVALTATATAQVVKDIQEQLKIPGARIFRRSFDRPNLSFQVVYKDGLRDPLDNLAELIRTNTEGTGATPGGPPPCAVVYTHKREECDRLASDLRRHGIAAAAYHAGMKDTDRAEAQDGWTSGKYKVIVATVAFGMGIDAPGVRVVAHFTLPKSLDSYYQEAGRAGRDGRPAVCRLYYSTADRQRLEYLTLSSANKRQGAAAAAASSSASFTSSSVAGGGGAAIAEVWSLDRADVADGSGARLEGETSRDGTKGAGGELSPSDPRQALADVIAFAETAHCRRVAALRHFGEAPDFSACQATVGQEACDYCRNPGGVEAKVAALKDGTLGPEVDRAQAAAAVAGGKGGGRGFVRQGAAGLSGGGRGGGVGGTWARFSSFGRHRGGGQDEDGSGEGGSGRWGLRGARADTLLQPWEGMEGGGEDEDQMYWGNPEDLATGSGDERGGGSGAAAPAKRGGGGSGVPTGFVSGARLFDALLGRDDENELSDEDGGVAHRKRTAAAAAASGATSGGSLFVSGKAALLAAAGGGGGQRQAPPAAAALPLGFVKASTAVAAVAATAVPSGPSGAPPIRPAASDARRRRATPASAAGAPVTLSPDTDGGGLATIAGIVRVAQDEATAPGTAPVPKPAPAPAPAPNKPAPSGSGNVGAMLRAAAASKPAQPINLDESIVIIDSTTSEEETEEETAEVRPVQAQQQQRAGQAASVAPAPAPRVPVPLPPFQFGQGTSTSYPPLAGNKQSSSMFSSNNDEGAGAAGSSSSHAAAASPGRHPPSPKRPRLQPQLPQVAAAEVSGPFLAPAFAPAAGSGPPAATSARFAAAVAARRVVPHPGGPAPFKAPARVGTGVGSGVSVAAAPAPGGIAPRAAVPASAPHVPAARPAPLLQRMRARIAALQGPSSGQAWPGEDETVDRDREDFE